MLQAFRRRIRKVTADTGVTRKTKYDQPYYKELFMNYAESGQPFDVETFGRPAYNAYRRRLPTLALEVETKYQGRYNAYDATTERECIVRATTLAGIQPVNRAATCHPNQVQKTARTLFVECLKGCGKPPLYNTWFQGKKQCRKRVPKSHKYLQRVQFDHKELWDNLRKTIARNTRREGRRK